MANYNNGLMTKNLVLEAAKELFYERGYQKTSFNEICKKANINNGLVVYHFGTKAQIAQSIYKEVIDSQVLPLQKAFPELDNITISILSLYSHYRLFFADANFRRFSTEVNMLRIAGHTYEDMAKLLPALYEGSLKYHDEKKTKFFFSVNVGLSGDIEAFLSEHLTEYTIDEAVEYTTKLFLPCIDDHYLNECIAAARKKCPQFDVSNNQFQIQIVLN